MKATIDIPDELYRQVKAKSALRGQRVREVAVSLFQGWIEDAEAGAADKPIAVHESEPVWFGAARKHARHVKRHDMAAVRRSIALGRSSESTTEKGSR